MLRGEITRRSQSCSTRGAIQRRPLSGAVCARILRFALEVALGIFACLISRFSMTCCVVKSRDARRAAVLEEQFNGVRSQALSVLRFSDLLSKWRLVSSPA